MKKYSFHLVPQAFLGFFAITEPDTGHVSPLVNVLGRAFSATAQAERYGTGVKSITVTLVLTDPQGLGAAHKLKRPKYSAGVRTINAHGVTVSVENTLEFGLRPTFADVRAVRTESDAAAALLAAIDQAKSAIEKLRVPDFDKELFFADLVSFLGRQLDEIDGSCSRMRSHDER